MKHTLIKQFYKKVFLVACFLFLPHIAKAAIDSATIESATADFTIESNGSAYVGISSGAFKADVRVVIENSGLSARKVKSYETWLQVRHNVVVPTPWFSLRLNSHKKTYKRKDRPHNVNKIVKFEIVALNLLFYVENACNLLANKLRQDGLTDTAIFSIDRTIQIGVDADLDYDLTRNGLTQANFPAQWDSASTAKLNVTCGKWAGAAIPPITKNLAPANPVVLGAWLILSEKTSANGTCKLNFNGNFKTSAPNVEVTFRYHDDKGNISDLKTETTGANQFAYFNHDYGVSNNPDGAETGAIRIVGVSHEFESEPWNYEMNCTAGAATKFDIVHPPKIKVVLASLEDYIEMPDKRICPTKARFMGTVDGNGHPFSGFAEIQVKDGEQNHSSDAYPANAPANSWVLFGGYVEELDWSQTTGTANTLATANSIGDTSKTLYAKVNVYNGDMQSIQPNMAFEMFKANCKVGPQMMVYSVPTQLQAKQMVQQTTKTKPVVKQLKMAVATPPNLSIIKADLGQPDLKIKSSSMVFAGAPYSWNSTIVVDNPSRPMAVGVGRSKSLCRFNELAYSPFNNGGQASGEFTATVYRNNQKINSAYFDLDGKSGLPENGWHKFAPIDLAQGMNKIKVVLDSNNQVTESNENNNTYHVRINVTIPCTAKSSALLNLAPGKKQSKIPALIKRAIPKATVIPTLKKMTPRKNQAIRRPVE